MRRRHGEWRKVVARWEASGESAAVFASVVGVSAGTLWRWRRGLSRETVAESAGHALAELVEVRPAALASDNRFEVRLAAGVRIGVPASFDEAALERLLRVLEARP
jgi:transposase-like protein